MIKMFRSILLFLNQIILENKKLIKHYIKQQGFNPQILGLFINPFFFARRGLYKNIQELIPNLKGKLLDCGCGTMPYKSLFIGDQYIGLEIEDQQNGNHSFADVFYDGKKIPFEDKSFDSILSSQVFEHVFNPDAFLKEINRISKLHSLFLITVPFCWDEHEQPYDYARYSSFGLRHILNKNGYEVLQYRKTNNGLEVIFQLLNDYIFKKTVTKNRYLNLSIMLSLMAPINIIGLLISKILPRNDDLYLDNVVLLKKIKDV